MGSSPILASIIIVAALYFFLRPIVAGFRRGTSTEDCRMVCPSCGTCGEPKTVTPGSIGIEIVLWLCLLIPGLVYSIWRMSAKYDACPACGQRALIPANSPNGRKIIEQSKA